MEPVASSSPCCPACGNIGGVGAAFCRTCGFRLADTSQPAVSLPVVRAQHAWRQVRSAALCYLVLLAEVVGFGAFDTGDSTVDLYVAADVVTLVVVVAFAWPMRRELVRLFRAPRMDAVAWALLLFGPAGLWLLNQGLLAAMGDLPGVLVSDPILELREAGASTGTVFLLVCVTPPFLEEAAFRGVILEKIRESFGTRPAVIVVSILFSVLHLALLSFIPFAALAVVLAALRLRTGSLWPAIVGHALFNLATMLFEAGGT
jgi:membrane protease YdiL (CAAX protease family)